MYHQHAQPITTTYRAGHVRGQNALKILFRVFRVQSSALQPFVVAFPADHASSVQPNRPGWLRVLFDEPPEDLDAGLPAPDRGGARPRRDV